MSLAVCAASWSGIIDPSRAIDWSQAGVPGGIPTNATQCGSTIAAFGSASSPQAATTINNAITNWTGASSSAPKYILLGPGTFYLNTSIRLLDNSYVILRGSGPDGTTLN